MVSIISYSSSADELKLLEKSSREAMAITTDDDCKIYSFSDMNKLMLFLRENSLLDILYFDVTTGNSIELLEKIRQDNKNTAILIIADISVSPITYMKPGIMASSLLLRPMDNKNTVYVIEEIIRSLNRNNDKKDMFILRSKEGNIRVPYSSILYFEAREKKIFLNTEYKEYAFYGTLESLSKSLPDDFMRCHKGFIINSSLIRRIALSNNEIELIHQRIIPISRSYKPDIKALYQNKE